MPIRNGISGDERGGRAAVAGNRSLVQAMMLGSSVDGLVCGAGGERERENRCSETELMNSGLETKCDRRSRARVSDERDECTSRRESWSRCALLRTRSDKRERASEQRARATASKRNIEKKRLATVPYRHNTGRKEEYTGIKVMTGSACHILPHQLGFGPPKPSRGGTTATRRDDCASDKYEADGTESTITTTGYCARGQSFL